MSSEPQQICFLQCGMQMRQQFRAVPEQFSKRASTEVTRDFQVGEVTCGWCIELPYEGTRAQGVILAMEKHSEVVEVRQITGVQITVTWFS